MNIKNILFILILTCFINVEKSIALDNTEINNNNIELFNNYTDSVAYYSEIDFEIAHKYMDTLLSLANDINTDQMNAYAHVTYSELSYKQKLYEKAIKSAIRSNEFAKKTKDIHIKTITLNNMISLFLDIDNPLKALQLKKELNLLIPKMTNENDLANSYHNIGIIYDENNYLDSSFLYYAKALAGYLSTSNKFQNTANLLRLYSNIGSFYYKRMNFDSAMYNYVKALELCSENSCLSGTICLNIGKTMLAVNKPDSAIYFYKKGLSIAESLDFIELESNAHKFISEQYLSTGLYKKALESLQKHILLNDSINGGRMQEKVWAIQIEYEKKQHRQNAKMQKLKSFFLIITILLITCGIIILINRKKIKHQKNSEIAMHKAEISSVQLKNVSLELDNKNQKLKEFTTVLLEKNALLEKLRCAINPISNKTGKVYKAKKNNILLKMKILTNEDWETFKSLFEEVNEGYIQSLQLEYPDLTEGDKRQFLLMKLGFDKNTTAEMMGISVTGAKRARQRLSKKLGLVGTEKLYEFIASFNSTLPS